MENEETKTSDGNEKTPIPPKFNIPTQMDYMNGFDFKPLNGSQVVREVITDTYVTASNNEDEMIKRIDDAMTILSRKVNGFAGYLSFYYLQLTLFYIMKNYELCFKSIDNIMKGVEAVEKFIFTGSYDGVEANGAKMTNYAFGESDSELKQTIKYLHDSWNVAKMVHAKAASFESGYSLLVTDLMLHAYNKQMGMMRKDCDNFRDLVGRIRDFIEKESNEEVSANSETEFMSIEDLKKENTENDSNGN